MGAVGGPGVAAAVDRLAEGGVEVGRGVSDLRASHRVSNAGIDNRAAGRTAARLLGRFVGDRRGSIGVLAGSMLVRDHRERFEGFASVMAADYPHLALLEVVEGRDDPALVERRLGSLFRERSDILGLYSLGAGNRGLHVRTDGGGGNIDGRRLAQAEFPVRVIVAGVSARGVPNQMRAPV